MNGLNKQIMTYLIITILAAVGLLVYYVPQIPVISELNIYGILAFITLSVLSEYMSVTLPYVGNISVTYAIDIALILIYGIPLALIISALGYLGTCLLTRKQHRKPLIKVAFNLSQFLITIAMSGILYQYIDTNYPDTGLYRFLPFVICALTYFCVNSVIVTGLFALLQGKSFFGTWVRNMRWSAPNFLALSPLGYVLSYVYTDIGTIGILIFFIPLLLARHSFKLYMDMREMYLNTIKSLATIIDAKDRYTAGHSERVAVYATAIAEQLKLSEDFVENLRDIALLHDIGKISIPENILNKPGRLDEDEYEKMKSHAEAGYEIVKQINFLKGPESIKHHHERWDGNGYGSGLAGEEIPLGARIIAVADAFDAMTTTRPYKKAMSYSQAIGELIRCKGTQFDPKIVDAFVDANILGLGQAKVYHIDNHNKEQMGG